MWQHHRARWVSPCIVDDCFEVADSCLGEQDRAWHAISAVCATHLFKLQLLIRLGALARARIRLPAGVAKNTSSSRLMRAGFMACSACPRSSTLFRGAVLIPSPACRSRAMRGRQSGRSDCPPCRSRAACPPWPQPPAAAPGCAAACRSGHRCAAGQMVVPPVNARKWHW